MLMKTWTRSGISIGALEASIHSWRANQGSRKKAIQKKGGLMDPDPMQYVEEQGEDEKNQEVRDARSTRKLNTLVAISVALLATFMGICKVKDDNIVQAMQQAQADKIDNYSWYQARNIREEIAKATIAELTEQPASAPQQAQAAYQEQIKPYQAIEQDQP